MGKGYTVSNLKRLRQFYILVEKGATLWHQLSWSHYRELIPLNDINKINYYIIQISKRNLSKRQLIEIIKSNEYERLDDETKNKLINGKETSVVDFVKNPIVIKNKYNYEDISEKMLQRLILEDISSFMKELGNGFSFIDSEYKIKLGDRYNYIDLLLKIKLGDRYNYIDLLLFNIEFNCYVVVELKVCELRKEYIGQIEVYMNYIDRNIKKISHDKTIGIIICKKNNKYVIKYCSDNRIISRKYVLV